MRQKISIFNDICQCWNSGQNPEGVANHLAQDVVWHYAAAIKPPAVGKAQAIKFMQSMGSLIASSSWRIFEYAQTPTHLFIEGIDEFITRDGQLVQTPYMGVLKFRGDLVCQWRDYFDSQALDNALAGKPLADFAQPLVNRATLAASAELLEIE